MSGVTGGASPVRLGTRRSALALVQSGIVAAALRDRGHDVEIVPIVTEGDVRAADTPWGEGAFVGAIERALLDGSIDIAVHSAKDVPTDERPELSIGAYLPREDPADVLVGKVGAALDGPDALPPGATVGTDSPRRTAFLRARRPDLVFRPLHGNVDTRLRRLDDGEADVLVLAAAGLLRLGREDRISARLDPTEMPPAPGQGAIAVQARTADSATVGILSGLDDAATRLAVETEREVLAASGGGCRAPVGALAAVRDGRVSVQAGFATADGAVAVTVTDSADVDDRNALVDRVLDALATRAAQRAQVATWPLVLVTRARDRWAPHALALVDRGFTPVSVPTIGTAPDLTTLTAYIGDLETFDWVVVTSAEAVRALASAAAGRGIELATAKRVRWAAVGQATARSLARAGMREAFQPSEQTAAALAGSIPIRNGDRVLLPLGDLAGDGLAAGLTERGAGVTRVTAYRTIEGPPASLPLLAEAIGGQAAGAVVSSPSAVRGLLTLAQTAGHADAVRALPLVAIGPTTAAEIERFGLRLAAVSAAPDPASVADAVRTALTPLEVR